MNKTFDWSTGDEIGDLLGGNQPKPPTPASDFTPALKRAPGSTHRQTYTDRCDKCRGTGRFVGFSGRDFGPCFKCKGKGTIDFKSTPAERQQAKDNRDALKKKKIHQQQVAFDAWAEANPAEMAWLRAKDGTFDFATSLFDAVRKFGKLTDGQMNALHKCMGRDADRKAEAQARIDNAASVDVSKIEQAFETARSKAKDLGALGIRWLKLRLGDFTFLDAPARGEWKAAILVREGEKKLGRIADGKFVRSFACDDPTEAKVIEAASDPEAAAIAYGMKFGACSICGKELTNEESIRRGIGPICAAKFGW